MWLKSQAPLAKLVITHVVLVKLKDNSPANVESVRILLKSMSGKIPSLRHLEIGTNIGDSEWAYDISLTAKFVDLDGLRSYDDHPVHLPVSNKLQELAANIVVVDYESD